MLQLNLNHFGSMKNVDVANLIEKNFSLVCVMSAVEKEVNNCFNMPTAVVNESKESWQLYLISIYANDLAQLAIL